MDRERDRRPGGDSALGRKRSWLRPPRALRATRAGWCFVAIIFGVGFAALNTGNNLLYLVLSMMLAFLVLSGVLSEASLRGLRIERLLPRELFADTPNRIVLRVHNTQRRIATFAITIEDRLEVRGERAFAGRAFVLRVAPGASSDRSYAFVPRLRGDIVFQGLRVSTRFPFGLFVKSREIDLCEGALVYPAVARVALDAPDPFPGRTPDERPGESKDGDEIAGLREFIPGDSLARVHWRSSVRAGRLRVGEREGRSAEVFEVRLNLPASAPDALIEERIARAASEVVTHLETGSRVGLRAKAMLFAPDTGANHRAELLTYLARAQRDPAPRTAHSERSA